MASKIPAWVKPGIWGVVVGAIGFAVIGFNADLVVTAKDAERSADREARRAVVAALTPICVAQFRGGAQADRTTHIAALEKESSWQRGDYIEKQGWATMPGATDANDEVATACATELLKVSEKPAGKTSG